MLTVCLILLKVDNFPTNQWRTQFTLIKVQTKNTLILKVVRTYILGFYQSGFIIAF